jgi:hypothetical protein
MPARVSQLLGPLRQSRLQKLPGKRAVPTGYPVNRPDRQVIAN